MISKLQKEITKLRCIVEKQKAEIQSLKNIVTDTPHQIYWKDTKGTYLGSNLIHAKLCQKLKPDLPNYSIIGMKDCDIFTSQTANQYRKNDLLVVDSENPLIAEEILILPNNKRITHISIKSPIYGKNKKVEGVLGQSSIVNVSLIQHIQKFFLFPKTESSLDQLKFFMILSTVLTNNSLKEGTPYQPLTIREKECAYHIIKGATTKEISKFLNISIRTVDTHLENIRNKLQCCSKSQLVKKLFSLCSTSFYN